MVFSTLILNSFTGIVAKHIRLQPHGGDCHFIQYVNFRLPYHVNVLDTIPGKPRGDIYMTQNHSPKSTAVPTMLLELIPLPVADIDRAKSFYVDKVGFNLDHDVQPNEAMRIVQLTPPGSACSIVIGSGMGEVDQMPSGSVKGLHLVVKDIEQLRKVLIERGVAMDDVIEFGHGVKYAAFSDPDGNSWTLQEFPPDSHRA
jgi:predicted enzyme related to lactoylglutathione lyase